MINFFSFPKSDTKKSSPCLLYIWFFVVLFFSTLMCLDGGHSKAWGCGHGWSCLTHLLLTGMLITGLISPEFHSQLLNVCENKNSHCPKKLTTDFLVQYYLHPKYNFVSIWLIRLLLIRQISTCSGTDNPKTVFLEQFLK